MNLFLIIAGLILYVIGLVVAHSQGFDKGYKKALDDALPTTLEIIEKRDQEWFDYYKNASKTKGESE